MHRRKSHAGLEHSLAFGRGRIFRMLASPWALRLAASDYRNHRHCRLPLAWLDAQGNGRRQVRDQNQEQDLQRRSHDLRNMRACKGTS